MRFLSLMYRINVSVMISILTIFFTTSCATARDRNIDQEFLNAFHRGDTHAIYDAVEKGADVNVKNGKRGITALATAAYYGDDKMVAVLLQVGADIDSKDKYGYTPLLFAILKEHRSTAEILIEQGANVNSATIYGYTPLHSAALHKFSRLCSLLIENGADVNAKENINWETPLYYAVLKGDESVVKILINENANPNTIDKMGCTPAMIAKYYQYIDVLKILHNEGANIQNPSIQCEGYIEKGGAVADKNLQRYFK